jgi:hypothetical protein
LSEKSTVALKPLGTEKMPTDMAIANNLNPEVTFSPVFIVSPVWKRLLKLTHSCAEKSNANQCRAPFSA